MPSCTSGTTRLHRGLMRRAAGAGALKCYSRDSYDRPTDSREARSRPPSRLTLKPSWAQKVPEMFSKVVGPPWPTHPHARCCWCGRCFVCVGQQRLWVCPTEACALRQQTWALKTGDKYIFLPTPRQVEFFEMQRERRRTLYGGAAGGAKSHSLRWAAYRYCLLIPNCEVLLLRRTYRDLELTHLREMRR